MVVAFLFVAAVPLAVSAAPAFTNFNADRTSITNGQSITISVTTTAQTQFVFATADGVRTQGTRSGGNNWTVTVSPTRSTTITVFANSANNENNAARITIPVTVTGSTTQTPTPTPPPTVTIPPAPANLGPVAIASITETPATQQGAVQLTIVTGRETNDVWVNFDRVNNARGTGRFARGTLQSQDNNSKTWVVNFRPAAWATQRVEIGSNRTYNWPGAATQTFELTLTQPFVAPVNPTISSVQVSNRTVATNANVTFTIRTNADVENVWVVAADGREHNATRTSGTSTNRNWTVTFNPGRSGNVNVFANTTRNEAGAATRRENITVGNVRAQIIGTPTATQIGGTNNTRITATTNEFAETVWAVMPNGDRRELSRTSSGTGSRTWSVDTWENWGQWNLNWNIVIHVSNQSGSIHSVNSDDSRTITRTGNLAVGIVSISPSTSQNTPSGGTATFTVTTSPDVMLSAWLSTVSTGQSVAHPTADFIRWNNNGMEWEVRVPTAGVSAGARIDVTLGVNSHLHGQTSASTITVMVQ
jgi:hypothetical protein